MPICAKGLSFKRRFLCKTNDVNRNVSTHLLLYYGYFSHKQIQTIIYFA